MNEESDTSAAPEAPRPATSGQPPINPYLAGMFLGLAVLASFLILGSGFSASEGLTRLLAWTPYHNTFFMLLGLFAGALISALTGKRMRLWPERGPLPLKRRLLLILTGGILAGFALYLISKGLFDQMLNGGVLLSIFGFVFLICFLIAGYAAARIAKRMFR